MVIKIVPDTNVILKGMFGYKSNERKIISLCLAKRISLYGCNETYNEFCEKVAKPRLQRYWEKKNFSSSKIILDYKSIINMHEPIGLALTKKIGLRDPDDEIFIRVALSCNAPIIISADNDLLDVKKFEGIKIVSADQFVKTFFEFYPKALIS